jgi:hypothetical protein
MASTIIVANLYVQQSNCLSQYRQIVNPRSQPGVVDRRSNLSTYIGIHRRIIVD